MKKATLLEISKLVELTPSHEGTERKEYKKTMNKLQRGIITEISLEINGDKLSIFKEAENREISLVKQKESEKKIIEILTGRSRRLERTSAI